MTDEQIRLYAIARVVAPPESWIRTIAERAAGGILYTIQLKTPYKGWPERFFAVHSNVLRAGHPDSVIAEEIRKAIGPPPASPGQRA